MTAHSPFGSNNFDPNSNSFVRKLNLTLEQIFQDEDLTIPQIAEQLNMDEVTLWRKVQRYYKTSPQLFLRDFRLTKAYSLLHDPEIRISEIAYDCGFKSLANFSRVFRHRYNASPLDVRRSLGSAG